MPTPRRTVLLAAAVVAAQLAAATRSPAQTEPVPAAPGQPSPASQPASRPTRELTGVKTQNGLLSINFKDATIDNILDELSQSAGFIVVKEVQPQGRVTLVSKQPVTADEAIQLLNTVLRNAGYTAIQQERILKIVNRDAARRLNIPVHSGADPDKIPNTDELITQVIPLRYSDSTQLKTDLQPLINPDADFTSNASSNVLIITDTSANIKRIVKIVASLDTSVADQVDVRVFQLKFADATTAAKLINDVFGNLDQARTQGSNAQAQQQGNGGGGGGFPGAGGFGRFFGGGQNNQNNNNNNRRSSGKVTASSDDRTNSVVVGGPADTLKIVDTVIKQLDANPAEDQVVYVYRLKNAQALNLESVLNALFNGTAITGRSNQSNADRLTAARSTSSSDFGSTSSGSTGGGGTRLTSSSTGGSNYAGRNVTQQTQQTAAQLNGQVNVIADVDSNSLLVRTAPGNYARVKLVLDELDRPVQQVLIKVLFAEVTHDLETDIGAQLSVLNLRDNRIAPNNTTATGAASGRTLGSTGGSNFGLPISVSGANGVAASGLVVQLLEENFQATIQALEQANKLDVLSRPYILASDNQLASIVVGQEVPFITNTRVTEAGQQINTTEYRDIGILLDVIPHVNPDGVVILDVAPEISTLTSQKVQVSDTLSQPVIAKRSAQSRVGVKSGQTIVIGGLMQDQYTESVSKVPLLGDIPILGYLFKSTSVTKTKTELLIFLTPHVAATPDVLDGMSKQEMNGTRLIPGAVGPGVYQEHLKGMDRGEAPPQAQRPQEFFVPPPPGAQPATTQPQTQQAPLPPARFGPIPVPAGRTPPDNLPSDTDPNALPVVPTQPENRP